MHKVRYDRTFLKSLGMESSDLAFAYGKIIRYEKIGKVTLAVIEWEKGNGPSKVNVKNLEVVK